MAEQLDDFRVALNDIPYLQDDELRYVADRAQSMALKHMSHYERSESWDRLREAALDELEARGIRC